MKTFTVEVWEEVGRIARWVFWMTVRAHDRSHAESMILGSNPPKRFCVR